MTTFHAAIIAAWIDQLMAFCWKILLPFGFLQVMINGIVLANRSVQ